VYFYFFKDVDATISSGESDGEDEIINLSDSSLSDDEKTTLPPPPPPAKEPPEMAESESRSKERYHV